MRHSIPTLRFIFHADVEIMILERFSNDISEPTHSSVAKRGCLPLLRLKTRANYSREIAPVNYPHLKTQQP